MYKCTECEHGFTFESHYKAHKMKHQKMPGHQCIKCKQWFMRSSELTAHLLTYGKVYTYCKELGVITKIRTQGMYMHMPEDIVMY